VHLKDSMRCVRACACAKRLHRCVCVRVSVCVCVFVYWSAPGPTRLATLLRCFVFWREAQKVGLHDLVEAKQLQRDVFAAVTNRHDLVQHHLCVCFVWVHLCSFLCFKACTLASLVKMHSIQACRALLTGCTQICTRTHLHMRTYPHKL